MLGFCGGRSWTRGCLGAVALTAVRLWRRGGRKKIVESRHIVKSDSTSDYFMPNTG
jgi:hypothetical protein